MGDGETTDAESPASQAVWDFIGAAAFFVLGNRDRLRSVTVGGGEVWTDELFAALEAYERSKRQTLADLVEAAEAELTGEDRR